MAETITCPSCGTEIEVTHALEERLATRLRAEYERRAVQQERAMKEREAAVEASRAELETARTEVEAEVSARLEAERAALEDRLRKATEEAVGVRMRELEEQVREQEGRLRAARDTELALRRRERELTERSEALELEVERKLQAEREGIRDAARRQADEEHRLRDADKEKQISDLRNQIEELKRRAEQGSQQSQGEVLELVLEELLRDSFPRDAVEPVPKGVHGGDVVHTVRDDAGTECGVILWESKRTKNWTDQWLPKLRDDQRAAKAAHAVIVSEALPKGCDTFALVDGVWVTGWRYAVGLATALRVELVEVAKAARALQGQQGKMELLYDYLAGPEFRNRVTGIVEAFGALRDDLEAEKRAMQRIWSKREKQLERAMISSSGMYGDLQGIIGAGLPEIEGLSMPALGAGGEEDDASAE